MPSAKKSVEWGKRPSVKATTAAVQQPPDSSVLDQFVNPQKSQRMKRLNVEIPADLHARVKAQCALQGRDMTQAIIEMLKERFPKTS